MNAILMDSSHSADVDKFWYEVQSYVLIQSLLFNVFTPQIDLILQWIQKFVFRTYDRGNLCSCFRKSKYSATKCKTVVQYVELYSGPEYDLAYKYAFILKFVFMSMMYGLALPIMFPITFLALVNLYVTDKLALTYWHKAPPNYDIKISKRAVAWLRKTTIPGVLFGYLCIGNHQMMSS